MSDIDLVITIGGTPYPAANYNRQAALDKPGATWSAYVESCDEDLWSEVTIEEDGITVLTGYLLSRTYEFNGVQLSGSDTYIRAHDTMVETDLETEIEYTAYDYAEYLLGIAGLSHSITEDLRDQGVEPGIKLGPGSVHEALMSVIKYAGVFVWVDGLGVVHIDELPDILGESYDGFIRHEKELSDETTRHTIKVYGLSSGSPAFTTVFGKAIGDDLGDPVERIGVIRSPHIKSSYAAEQIAEAALEYYNSHDDIRTIVLDGFRPELYVSNVLDDEGDLKHITQVSSSVDELGATTTVVLDRRAGMFDYTLRIPWATTVETVFVIAGSVIARTKNFANVSPSWVNITPTMDSWMSSLSDMWVDQDNSSQEGPVPMWAIGTDKTEEGEPTGSIWKTANACATTVSWSRVLTNTQFKAVTGYDILGTGKIIGDGTHGVVFAQVSDTNGSLWILRTLNGGSTWTYNNVGAGGIGSALAFTVGESPNYLYSATGTPGEIAYSTDAATSGGFTFSTVDLSEEYNIHAPISNILLVSGNVYLTFKRYGYDIEIPITGDAFTTPLAPDTNYGYNTELNAYTRCYDEEGFLWDYDWILLKGDVSMVDKEEWDTAWWWNRIDEPDCPAEWDIHMYLYDILSYSVGTLCPSPHTELVMYQHGIESEWDEETVTFNTMPGLSTTAGEQTTCRGYNNDPHWRIYPYPLDVTTGSSVWLPPAPPHADWVFNNQPISMHYMANNGVAIRTQQTSDMFDLEYRDQGFKIYSRESEVNPIRCTMRDIHLIAGWFYKSTVALNELEDITPIPVGVDEYNHPSGYRYAPKNLHAIGNSGNSIYALFQPSSESGVNNISKLRKSIDGGTTWVELFDFSGFSSGSASGQHAMFCHPASAGKIYMCQKHSTVSEGYQILYCPSESGSVTFYNKMGNWASSIGATWWGQSVCRITPVLRE